MERNLCGRIAEHAYKTKVPYRHLIGIASLYTQRGSFYHFPFTLTEIQKVQKKLVTPVVLLLKEGLKKRNQLFHAKYIYANFG